MVYAVAVERQDDVPASIAAAWGRGEARSKGPKPGLTLDRIVDAGVRIAARDGLDAVSMSRVAKELGASPMGLYRYVGAKDELLALMVDAAVGAPPERRPREGWRAALERWAWGYHHALRRHPWVLRVPISAPAITPNATRWLEAGLAGLRPTKLTEPQKLSVMLLLSGYVRNEATLTADLAVAAGESQIMPRWGEALARLADPEQFPELRAALASPAFAADDDPDDEFVFGLERTLDGIDALVRRTNRRR